MPEGPLCIYISPVDEPGQHWRTFAEAFAESYIRHPAGHDHRLLVINKGDWPGNGFERIFPDGTEFISHPNTGYDIGSLVRIAMDRKDEDWLLLFSAYSRILDDDWLAKMMAAAQLPDVAMVGTTGSYEGSRWTSTEGVHNPHIRTSGFLCHRQDLIDEVKFMVTDKASCYEFEHGTQSLYRRLRAQGKRCVIVGADGMVFDEDVWPVSNTFRHGDQTNLLIADNHSDYYAATTAEERVWLAGLAGWKP